MMDKHISKLKLDDTNTNTKSFLKNVHYNQFGLQSDQLTDDIKLTQKFKTYGKKHFLYFFSDDISKHVYLAIIDTPFKFWSQINTPDELYTLLELYDLADNVQTNLKCHIKRGLINEEIPNIKIFEKYSYLNQLIVPLPWGEEYKPDVFILNDKTPFEIAIYNSVILEENTTEINFMTKYSRSIISISCIDYKYFVQLKYKSSQNKNLPQDLIMVLATFPSFIEHNDLLKLDPPMIQEALTSCSGIPMFLDDIYDDLICMHKQAKYNNKIKLEINDTLETMTANKEIFNFVNNHDNKCTNKEQILKIILKKIITSCDNINVKTNLTKIKNHTEKTIDYILDFK